MAFPDYPGDPRARPAAKSVFVSATGAIKKRRDDLISRAAVCKLEGNSHDSLPSHVADALRSRLGLGWLDFQVIKHYPEQYLVIFKDEQLRQRITRQRRLEDDGRVFYFDAWKESRGAADAHLEFRVNVRIEGIPPHAWGEDVATLILGRSCAIHYVEEHTRRRERTRTYDLWAWCADPCKIPRRVWLTITDPDAEQPPVDVPRNLVQVHHEEPTGLKHALGYEILPHVQVVEDLSFIRGGGGQGGPPNRKRRRVFEWRYGHPDSAGEVREDRGREEHRRHRRDDRDDDRGRYNRRHRSSSAWGRVVRCRNDINDCYSSNLRGGGRAGGSYRSRNMQWIPKMNTNTSLAAAAKKTSKRVVFADPVATVMGKGRDELVPHGGDLKMPATEGVGPALAIINDLLTHLEGPVNPKALEALQALIDHSVMMELRKGGNGAMIQEAASTGAQA